MTMVSDERSSPFLPEDIRDVKEYLTQDLVWQLLSYPEWYSVTARRIRGTLRTRYAVLCLRVKYSWHVLKIGCRFSQ